MNTHHADELNIAITAARWLERLKSNTPQELSECMSWLRQSPLHVRHFLMVSELDRELDDLLPQLRKPVVTAAAGPALTLVGNTERAGPQRAQPARGISRRTIIGALAASVLLAAGGLFVAQYRLRSIEYTTAVGEQRSVDLGDGSVMRLNAVSHLAVRFTRTARSVQLLRGEALFDVAHDAARPFRVRVGHSVIEAVGTQFVVYKQAAQSTVAVLQGCVVVSGRGAPVPVGAGQLTHIQANGRVEPAARGNVQQVAAWRDGFVWFEHETLANIATELNRYRAEKLVVKGDWVRQLRYTVTLPTKDPSALLEWLAREPGVVVEQGANEVLIRPAPPPGGTPH